jgi:hypothetical protein
VTRAFDGLAVAAATSFFPLAFCWLPLEQAAARTIAASTAQAVASGPRTFDLGMANPTGCDRKALRFAHRHRRAKS